MLFRPCCLLAQRNLNYLFFQCFFLYYDRTWRGLLQKRGVLIYVFIITSMYIKFFFERKKIVNYNSAFWYRKKIRCRRMVDLFTTTYVISAYHHWYSEFESRSGRDVQHYVIKFVSDFRQVGGFLRVLWSPAPIKLTTAI